MKQPKKLSDLLVSWYNDYWEELWKNFEQRKKQEEFEKENKLRWN